MTGQAVRNLTARKFSCTRARVYECVGCVHRITERLCPPPECLRCGMQNGYRRVQLAELVKGHAGNSPDIQQATEFLPAKDWLPLFPKGIPRGLIQLWYGGKGTGKSRLAMRLATSLGRTEVCALEMGEQLTAEIARQSGSKMRNYWGSSDLGALWHDLPFVEPLCIVVDSIQELRHRQQTISRLYDWAQDTGGIVILISQVNARNTARGGPAGEHKVDVVLRLTKVRDGWAKFAQQKNRLSLPEGEPVFWLGSGKPPE
jgi:hypothetical protein